MEWKKANLVSIHKNYQPISLLSIYSKIYERLIQGTVQDF